MRLPRCLIALPVMILAGCSGAAASRPVAPQPPARIAFVPARHRPQWTAQANRACRDLHPLRQRVSSGTRGAVGVSGGPHANLRVLTTKRLVALSFDDGPTTAYTPRVLALLARAHARATFFDIGRLVAVHPALVRRELSSGNEVANHTYTHTQLAREGAHGALRLPKRSIIREIALTRSALCRAGAPDPKLFRPPYGRGVFAAEIDALAANQGERVVGWNLALEHFIDNPRPLRASVTALLARVRPGAIILAHDGPALRERTLSALPLLLQGLDRLGYRAVAVGKLLQSGVVVGSG